MVSGKGLGHCVGSDGHMEAALEQSLQLQQVAYANRTLAVHSFNRSLHLPLPSTQVR
jgi:hypothetical protein